MSLHDSVPLSLSFLTKIVVVVHNNPKKFAKLVIGTGMLLQSDAPYHGHLTEFFANCPPIRMCEFD